MYKTVAEVTARIRKRSGKLRAEYLSRLDKAEAAGRPRSILSCGNLAHGFAACPATDKEAISDPDRVNLAIVTAYNDMLSAHQPYERYPAILRDAARAAGATAQVAGGTPAMCDGVTQGREGMQLSLFSRDAIAQATAIGLSHGMFDGALLLGICDKIVPGLLIGALSFGHLPMVFVPGGPMRSGLPNKEKARVRKLFAQGKVGRVEMLATESSSYHSPGTCTFYGTANSNQMFMEIMGLHLPGSSFVNPDDPLRDAFTREAANTAVRLAKDGAGSAAVGRMLDERALVNAIVGLLATGGSTNHTIHLVAVARAAGLIVDWRDFEDLSGVVPLLARLYPNGEADVNHFRDAGGMAFIISELASAGLLHDDVMTLCGKGLTKNYVTEQRLAGDRIEHAPTSASSADTGILRGCKDPFSATGGIRLLDGNLGRGIVKVSAVAPEHRKVRAPALVCDSQEQLQERLKKVDGDVVAVVRFQGVRANGMPELHKLTPALSNLQDRGLQVALVTDGRMSGASGQVPAAIHMSPEAVAGGPLARLQDGDIVEVDCDAGTVSLVGDLDAFERRKAANPSIDCSWGCGRELFAHLRSSASGPEQGASALFEPN